MGGCERHSIGVTHTSPFPVASLVWMHCPISLATACRPCCSPIASCTAYLWNARLANDILCKRQGSKFYAMVTCFETGHARQDGVWWPTRVLGRKRREATPGEGWVL